MIKLLITIKPKICLFSYSNLNHSSFFVTHNWFNSFKSFLLKFEEIFNCPWLRHFQPTRSFDYFNLLFNFSFSLMLSSSQFYQNVCCRYVYFSFISEVQKSPVPRWGTRRARRVKKWDIRPKMVIIPEVGVSHEVVNYSHNKQNQKPW